MRLSFGLMSLVAGLALMGFLARAQLQRSPSSGDSSPAAALAAARQVTPLAALQQAVAALERHQAENGTYAGAIVTGPTVRLVRADAASYCVEAAELHVAGPGGGPVPGPC